ncbi:MAG: FtsX-like permease family protein [Clostridia bacterium]|nr:FtsX-like permease family protein [Clostridia bacterium]
MVISVKDGVKIIAVSIVCFCAVFVSTFMLNFYLDVLPLDGTLEGDSQILFTAQLATAKFTSALAGGFLGVIAALMTVFYIKLFIDAHSAQLGILKALGYSDKSLAIRFWVFGLCVLIGCAAGFGGGFIAMPFVYKGLTIEGLEPIKINFHPVLLICLVIIPAIVFAAISCLYAYFALRRPVNAMIKGTATIKPKKTKNKQDKERAFIWEMCFKTLSSKKILVFFVAFSCFCFSAMVQMGLSMDELTPGTMAMMILVIGVVLAFVTMLMSVTALVKANIKNIAVMKAFGYDVRQCTFAVFAGYVPFALIGFGVGTAYQYGLLNLMVNLVFKDVGEVPDYTFNVPVLFITLAVFIVLYVVLTLLFTLRLSKISVKEIMAEN